MELRQIRYFVAVARKKHFTQAAEELRLAQPALSQQIQQLEQELRVALFVRTSRRVSLTPAGEAFFIRAERILAEVERAHREMQEFAGLGRGHVSIGALQSLGVFRIPALLARFHARHPGIEISLREEANEKLLELLNTGELDLSLIQITKPSSSPDIDSSSIITEQILTEELVLVVAPDHPLAGRQQVEMRELRDEPFVLFKPGSGLRRVITQSSRDAGFTPRILFESGELGMLRSLVAEGLGVTILPRSVAEAPGREVSILSLGTPGPMRTILLAWQTPIAHSPAASAFLAFMRNDIREYPWDTV